ncbi:hypothetical protein BLX87_00060 [Bacillus sp. VT-16-64]|nr:hypothetical protein BLX87_00060 [Bacillus sp. VT-16-64]
MAQAARRQTGAAAGREPAGGAWRRRVTRPGPQAGHGRHHGAAEGHHLSDRCQAAARGDPGPEPPGGQASPFIGVGYQFNNYLRADATVGYSQRDSNYYETTTDLWEAMANAYVDLGNYYGITPYVGGGIGFANVNYDYQGPVDARLKSGGTNRFEWALMAGIAVDITPRLKLDLGYRYAASASNIPSSR